MEKIKTLKEQIIEVLMTCYDPEIPVNIVELGLVYDVTIEKLEHQNKAIIKMTLTSPTCPMADWILEDIRVKVFAIDSINSVEIKLTFDPPWSIDKLSEKAKLELNML